jgi:hypothetical protein
LSLKIDFKFVQKWAPRYDRTEDDEGEYHSIIKAIRSQIDGDGRVSQSLFEDIVRWKAARLLGRGQIGKVLSETGYRSYDQAIKRTLAAKDETKISSLITKGIGTPVASTILHFMYPDRFPIMDVRTVEVLNRARYIGWKSRELKNYAEFTRVLRAIASETHSSLRDVDRALFAYHKQVLSGQG